MTEEPTVLDYVKAKLKFWQAPAGETLESRTVSAPPPGEAVRPAQPAVEGEIGALPPKPRPAFPFPWRTLLAFFLGLLAQISLQAHKEWFFGAFMYIMAFLWVGWANWCGEWRPELAPERADTRQPATIRPLFLLVGMVFAGLAYINFRSELFTRTNTTLWVLALASFTAAFWITTPGVFRRAWDRLWGWLKRPQVVLSSWTLLLIALALLAVYFRANLINEIPSQMNSDHAEKLLDVWDLEQGYTRVFFPRNTGREAFQFFLIAAVDKYLHTGISFLSMKIGAIAAGLLTLPFIYLIGLEIGNRWVGLWAMAFAGIAYWPNVISRLALRFTFYPFFAAPTLYFLIRGLRRRSQNDLLLSGLILGLGLHSYTPIRILPVVVVVGVVLFMLHHIFQVKITGFSMNENISLDVHLQPGFLKVQKQAIAGLAVLTLIAVIGFIPLLRYIANPINREMFFYRTFTRTGSLEQPLPGKPLNIFLSNTWNAMRMFGWDGGDVWTVSVPHRPALDTVSAALCYLGMGLVFWRYVRKRNWLDLFLLLSLPLLMLPSILSLAFPQENPVLSRTSGAIIPVFVMVGIAMESLLSTLRERMIGSGVPRLYALVVAAVLGSGLFLLAANANYDLVFNQYRKGYELSSWNSTEMGAVYKDFATTIGNRDSFWLVGYPHWVDSRLISIAAGYPERDCAIMPDTLAASLDVTGAKMFLLHPEAVDALATLQSLYPLGAVQEYQSKFETKNFLMFFVPPSQ